LWSIIVSLISPILGDRLGKDRKSGLACLVKRPALYIAVDAGTRDYRQAPDIVLQVKELLGVSHMECHTVEDQVGPVAQRFAKRAAIFTIGGDVLPWTGDRRGRSTYEIDLPTVASKTLRDSEADPARSANYGCSGHS
jgi:hypothetical protein